MPGESYIGFECRCGHHVQMWIADRPPALTMDRNGNITPETLERLRCTACGHRGRPQRVTLGWGHRNTKFPAQLGAPE